MSGGDGSVRHVPVLVGEVVEYLQPWRGGLYMDGTVGDGGHGLAILVAGGGARLLGVDRDGLALEVARRRLAEYGERVRLAQGDYADVLAEVREPLAGVLLDLGLSSRQLDEAARGFSFRPGTPLDMRMSGAGRTAADLLNGLSEPDLADLFWRYGEERRSRRLAAAVVESRRVSRFAVSDDLVAVLERLYGGRLGVKDKARVFQALRIAVNDELRSLERGLSLVRDRLASGGVVVVLSYHSLEDRLVKAAFREWSIGCICPPALPVCGCGRNPLGGVLTRRPVVADAAELAANPRARSVRLRAWRKAA